MHHVPSVLRRRSWLAAVAAAALLAACGGGVGGADHGEDHDHPTIETAGRLVLAEQDARAVRVLDLDRGAIEATYTVDHVPSALHASPGGRYAVVMQRLQDQVQFIDGGIWQEDHGDHLHDYRQASAMAAWKLSGTRPTHYDLQAGRQAALFMDGDAASTPPRAAGVRLITDAAIAAGSVVANLDLAGPIHGLGEPVDGKLLTVARAEDAADALPTHLALHLRDGATWRFVRQLPTRCDGMHGSFSSGTYTVAGCVDGMLVVRHADAATVTERKAATPLRVSTIAGHPRLPGQFIGIATEGAAPAPVTTRFHALDGESATATLLQPQGWETGRVRRAHGFDRSGQRFFILDDQGALTVLQRQGGGWVTVARTPGVIPAMTTAAPAPAFAANGARDEVYLTDPVARQLLTVNSTTGAVIARRDLGFVPSYAAWTGITR